MCNKRFFGWGAINPTSFSLNGTNNLKQKLLVNIKIESWVQCLGTLMFPFGLGLIFHIFFMALGINQVTYSNREFCRSVGLSVCLSVGPGFATLGTSR